VTTFFPHPQRCPSRWPLQRAWSCSLGRGHAGVHQAHWGHDIERPVSHTWENVDEVVGYLRELYEQLA
jgi:hypothetical protein